MAHAAQWTLRRAGNWAGVLKLLDEPSSEPIRAIALRAIAGQHDLEVIDGLIDRLTRETDTARRQDYADLLTRVYKKSGPWVYWGFRPAPRPASTVAWERTDSIAKALDDALRRLEPVGRTAILRRMVREKVPATATTLATMLRDEHDADRVTVILAALSELAVESALDSLELVLNDSKHTTGNRLVAASAYLQGLKTQDEKRLLATAEAIEDGPVLAEFLRALGTRKSKSADGLLIRKTTSANADVRMRAIEALAQIGTASGHPAVEKLLDDPDSRVRAAAARGTVSPSFESLVIELKNQRTLTGLKVEETDSSLVVVDSLAKKHVVAKTDIEAVRKSALSTMPEGIEKTLKEEEFVDLVAFLVSLKTERGK